ncbi:MAG: hypothetical protein V4722_17365 [Bacteroidota bacterium]
MDIRIEKLIGAFVASGWTLEGSVDISQDWWYDDILLLVSNWKPVGTNLYVTLLTDPQDLKKKIIWSVGISLFIPNDRHFGFSRQIALNDILKTDLKLFVNEMNKVILN